MSIKSRVFGETKDGRKVSIFTLENANGMKAEITNYGGTVVSLHVPDKNGTLGDVVLGFDELEGYLAGAHYFGAIIGRYANRIGNALFELNGEQYHLAKNDGGNHLHGGNKGFDKVVWESKAIERGKNPFLMLTYRSRDGEEGYPGNLDVRVTYTITDDNSLKIEYMAVSDMDTVVNLTNHTYFNLACHASDNILNHEIMINAAQFTTIDSHGIPNGEIRRVGGTSLELTDLTPVSDGLSGDDEQIILGQGYDHNWVLNEAGNLAVKAAALYEPLSGRMMSVYTTKPGLQFYSGNYLDGKIIGKQGVAYEQRSGLCLETQYFPDSMKHKHFPSPVLKKGEVYKHTTVYKFSAYKLP